MSIERNINNTASEKSNNETKKPDESEPQKPFDLDEALSDEKIERLKKMLMQSNNVKKQ